MLKWWKIFLLFLKPNQILSEVAESICLPNEDVKNESYSKRSNIIPPFFGALFLNVQGLPDWKSICYQTLLNFVIQFYIVGEFAKSESFTQFLPSAILNDFPQGSCFLN
jgi:hypothetical protein